MEPLTHFLTGACIGRSGFNRKTAYATLVGVLAAEAADLDVIWGLAGPVEGLKHHRGITHSFVGAPVVAGVVVGAVWLLYRWREGRLLHQANVPNQDRKSRPQQPVRWRWLYLTALIAALSHILLDWTNNYGIRPFLPFNGRWYEGSIVFIVEPVLWALFFVALVLPWIFGLADREIGARRKPFRGRGWAIFALAGMVTLWCWRWAEHAHARELLDNLQVTSEPVRRVSLEPYPINPFRWHAILETADFYQTAEINTWTGSIDSDPQQDVLYKPTVTPAVEAARQTFLGQIYLDWGMWAVVRDVGQEPVPAMKPPQLPPGRHWTTIEFTDLRFDYPFLGTGRRKGRSPLAGWVYIVDNHIDAGEAMDGRQQR